MIAKTDFDRILLCKKHTLFDLKHSDKSQECMPHTQSAERHSGRCQRRTANNRTDLLDSDMIRMDRLHRQFDSSDSETSQHCSFDR